MKTKEQLNAISKNYYRNEKERKEKLIREAGLREEFFDYLLTKTKTSHATYNQLLATFVRIKKLDK